MAFNTAQQGYIWFPFKNNSGYTIPPYSIIAVTGCLANTSRVTLTCGRTNDNSKFFVSTGGFATEDQSLGDCCITPHKIVTYTGTLAAGDRCKAKSNDWVVEKSTTGDSICVGIVDSTRKISIIYFSQQGSSEVKLIKAPSGGIPGRVGTLLGSATCDVWNEAANGQIQDSGEDILVDNWAKSAACKTGDRYGIAAQCNGGWYIVAEDCNDTGSTIGGGTGTSSGGTIVAAIDTSTTTPASVTGIGGEVRFRQGTTGSMGSGSF